LINWRIEMSKNTGKNKKKNKPYYKKQEVSNNKETKVSNSPMSNNTFLLGVGFLIIIYSRYLANQLSSVLVNILGLGVMFYAMFRSFNEDKENGKKKAVVIDSIIMGIIGLAIIYSIYWLTQLRF
jgi:hypothetical protein